MRVGYWGVVGYYSVCRDMRGILQLRFLRPNHLFFGNNLRATLNLSQFDVVAMVRDCCRSWVILFLSLWCTVALVNPVFFVVLCVSFLCSTVIPISGWGPRLRCEEDDESRSLLFCYSLTPIRD
jgi:hypothetical protein